MKRNTILILIGVLFTGCCLISAGVHIGEQATMDVAPDEGDKLPIYDISESTGYAITVLNLMGALESALTSYEINADNLPNLSGLNGALAASQQANRARSKFIPVTDMVADGSGDPGNETELNNITYRDFASDSSENLEFRWQIPEDVTGTTVKMRVLALVTSSTTPENDEGVVWNISACCSGTNDSYDCTPGLTALIADTDLDDDAGAQWDLIYFPYHTVSPALSAGAGGGIGVYAGGTMKIVIERDHDQQYDDYGQDIGLVGVEIKWQEDPGSMTY